MPQSFNPCFLIPVYNHKDHLESTFQQLQAFQHPVFVVNDGSDLETTLVLRQLCAKYSQVHLFERLRNGGKGAAVQDAIWQAFLHGHTHALQLDADGQHNIGDIPVLLTEAKKHLNSMILGSPHYGSDAPIGRIIGRQISKFWVWIETLSTAIEDPLVGFRVYPIAPCIPLIRKEVLGNRMEFDLQILVRLFWAGVRVVNVPTHITYPQDGASHFRMVHDNIQISKAHTALFFGMLWRAPRLLFHKGRA